MNKQETKYALTAQKMDEALLELLSEKELPYITVKEICKLAGVNRSTFYLHYETIDDLLSECVELINHRFTEYFQGKKESFAKHLANDSKDELFFITPEYLKPYLSFIKDNKRLFQTVLSNSHALGMQYTYAQMLQHVFEPVMHRFKVPKEDQNYLIRFYIQGIMAIIAEWLENNCTDSIEHLVSVIQRCIITPSS